MNSKFFEYEVRESIILDDWEKKQIYTARGGEGPSFKIDTPPPTVSGFLHMGHVFSYVQADIIARYKRMQGYSVFYPIGFDDNGLPTERLVEKLTGKKVGKNITHKEFIVECHKIVESAEKEFEELFRKIGLSVDFNLKYQTISPKTAEISQASFMDLYKKGLIYQKIAPVYFDIVDKTALAQADIEDREQEGYEVVFKAKLADLQTIEIMTTRPEMLPACKAVLFHPEDSRYKHLQGAKVFMPTAIINNKLEYNLEVPLISDFEVIMEKGTGLVMTCAFGDIQDKIWIERHNLKVDVNFISDDGKLMDPLFTRTSLSPDTTEEHGYMNILEGRRFIIEKMLEVGLIPGSYPGTGFEQGISDIDIKLSQIIHSVKCGERSGKPVEILLKNQWYLSTLSFRENLKEVIKKIDFHPSYMKARLEKWVDGLNQDWCISRERFFGINIPVRKWDFLENAEGNQFSKNSILAQIVKEAGASIIDERSFLASDAQVLNIEQTILQKKQILEDNGFYSLNVKTENLVLDTWFTSSLTPSIAKGFFNPSEVFDLRPQSHEIIRTWAFYTILKSHLHSLFLKDINKVPDGSKIFEPKEFFSHRGEEAGIPWKNVMLSGWCLASDKTKMSKSKNNSVTPIELISQKGVDVIRLWCASASLGADTAYSPDFLETGKKFINKLWNASKFAYTGIQKLSENAKPLESFDKWILSLLKLTLDGYIQHMEKFEYFKAKELLDNFFWNALCNYYLEIIKVRYHGIDAKIYEERPPSNPQQVTRAQASALVTLKYIFETIIPLYAPFAPFICEEVYGFIKGVSPHAQGSLKAINIPVFEEDAGIPLYIIDQVRKFKTDNALPLNSTLESFTVKLQIVDENSLDSFMEDLKNVTGIQKFLFEK